MDQAASQSTQITAADYSTLGRRQAEFWASQAQAAKNLGTDKMSLGFKDLVDVINPLQHLPLVRNIYQAVTGDNDMKPAMKFVGDTLYGGPMGAISSGVDAIIKQASGKDMLETVVGWFGGAHSAAQTAVADNSAPAASAAGQTASSVANTVAAASANDDTKSSDVKWNQAEPSLSNRFAASLTTSPATPAPTAPEAAAANDSGSSANATQLAAADAPKPSAFCQSLKKNVPGNVQFTPQPQKVFFNPTAKQFAGVQPAAYQTPAAAGVSTFSASAKNPGDLPVPGPVDPITNSQSDFAQKMMNALDRYQAVQQTGTDAAPAVTPAAVNQGL